MNSLENKTMWEDEILEEIHKTREEHAKSLNYDIKAICEDWRKRQAQSGRKVVRSLIL